MFSLTISKSRNLKPFATIVPILVLLSFKNGVLKSNQFLFLDFQRNKERLISTPLLKAPRAFTGGKCHSLPVYVGEAPARSKLGQETVTWQELGVGSVFPTLSLKCHPSSTLDPRGRPQLAWYLGEACSGQCIKMSKDLIKTPQHILSLISFFPTRF